MRFKFDTSCEITITHSLRENRVVVDGIELDELLENVDTEDILKILDTDEVLKKIGKEAAMKYFKLKEESDDN